MRRDAQRLLDIQTALCWVVSATQGLSVADFVSDEKLHFAVAQQLTIVGEAAANLSPELRARHPQIPWKRIVAFRNLIVHEYFGIHWPIVWQTATSDAPALQQEISAILPQEMPQ